MSDPRAAPRRALTAAGSFTETGTAAITATRRFTLER
jgi:hypothetical protein